MKGIRTKVNAIGIRYIPDSEMKRVCDSIRSSCGQVAEKLKDIRKEVMDSPDEEYEDNDLTQDKNK